MVESNRKVASAENEKAAWQPPHAMSVIVPQLANAMENVVISSKELEK